MGHKSHDPCIHVFLMEARVTTFVAHYTVCKLESAEKLSHSLMLHTGHGSIIGYKSGKVLGYATKIKRCKKCELGHSKQDHDCRLNFQGSAKAMEPAMAVDLIVHNEQLRSNNVKVSTLIGKLLC